MDDEKKKLTAKYIYDHQEWLEIALDVYEAMPTLRDRLIAEIWQRIWKRVAKQLGDRVQGYIYGDSYYGFCFYPKDGELMICAESWKIPNRKTTWGPTCSVYAEDHVKLDDGRREEIIDLFEKVTDDQIGRRWSRVGHRWSTGKYLAVVNVGNESWNDDFLRRAVRNRKEIVSNLADLLVGIYENMENKIK